MGEANPSIGGLNMSTDIRIVLVSLLLMVMGVEARAQKKWTLEQCIDYAYEHNLEIVNSRINNGIKKVDLRIAKNEKLPDLNGYTNMYTKFGQGQDVFGTTRRNDNLNAEAGINANIYLYNQGKLSNEIHKADLLVNVSEEELAVIKRNIAIKVIEYYLAIQLNKEIARAVDSSAYYAGIQYDKAEKTTKAGTTALSVQYEAKANWAKELQKAKKANQDIDRAKINIVQLIQYPDYKTFDIAELESAEHGLKGMAYPLEDAVTMASNNHPEVKRLNLQRKVFEIDNKIIKADLYPTVRGGAMIGSLYFNSLVTSGDPKFFGQIRDNFAQQIAVTVSIPIFNKGRVKNNLAKNNFVIQQNEIANKQQLNTIRQEIEKLYFDYRAYLDQYDASLEMLSSAKMALGFTINSYEAGKSSIYDLNISRANTLNAESETLQAKYNCLFVSKMIKFYIEEKL